jgi:hypothetical protein
LGVLLGPSLWEEWLAQSFLLVGLLLFLNGGALFGILFWFAAIGAAGWAFSNYLVFFLGYPLSPAAAPFPLLLLGLRRLARAPGRGPVAIVVAALLLIVTSGHPESMLHTVAAAGLYFLYALYRARTGHGLRAVACALAAGVLTLGLSAVLLLPLMEACPTQEHFPNQRGTRTGLDRNPGKQSRRA